MTHPGVFAEHPAVERLVARASGRVLDVAADGLDGEPASFDTILSVRTLCAAKDLEETLAQMLTLLAPGGQVLAVEHVRSPSLLGRMQDAASPMWRLMASGCRANRDLLASMRANGFAVVDCDRFMMNRAFPILAPHVAIVAVRKIRPEPKADTE